MESLRNNIALVSQEILLFDDTVRANIAFSKPDATEEEIVRAAADEVPQSLFLSLRMVTIRMLAAGERNYPAASAKELQSREQC